MKLKSLIVVSLATKLQRLIKEQEYHWGNGDIWVAELGSLSSKYMQSKFGSKVF
jgi:hypothetical protein